MIRKIFRDILSMIAHGIGYMILTILFLVLWLAGTVALFVGVMGSLPSLAGIFCGCVGSVALGWLLKASLRLLFPWWNPQFLLDEDEVY